MHKKIIYPLALSTLFLVGCFMIATIKPTSTDDPETTYASEGSTDNNIETSGSTVDDTASDIPNNAVLSESQNAELNNNVTSVLDSIDDALDSLDNIDELN